MAELDRDDEAWRKVRYLYNYNGFRIRRNKNCTRKLKSKRTRCSLSLIITPAKTLHKMRNDFKKCSISNTRVWHRNNSTFSKENGNGILLLAIIGLASGIVGALVGLGGGIILVPATLFIGINLGMIDGITPQSVVGLSVVMMIFTGLASTLAYMKRKRLIIEVD